VLLKRVDGLLKTMFVFQERCDVVERDARLRKIRNFANEFLQVIHAAVILASYAATKRPHAKA
jgi:hypothetical protein